MGEELFFEFIMGFFLVLLFIVAVCSLFVIIGEWKVLKKAGKGGWEALIPIYNKVVLCEISGINPMWIVITMVTSILVSFLPILGIVSFALSIYFNIILYFSLAKSFDRSEAFGIGLYFAPPIFFMILGFSSSTYIGKKPINDFIGDKFGLNSNKNDDIIKNSEPAKEEDSNLKIVTGEKTNNNLFYCPGCGAKLENGTKFCGSCGRKI